MNYERKLIDEINKLVNSNQLITGFYNGSTFIADNGTIFSNFISTSAQPGTAFLVPYENSYLCVVSINNGVVRKNIITDRRKIYVPIKASDGNLLILYSGGFNNFLVNNNTRLIKNFTIPTINEFSTNFAYIHNNGRNKTYNISIQSQSSLFFREAFINYKGNEAYIFDTQQQPYYKNESGSDYYRLSNYNLYYKGNLKYLTNNINLLKNKLVYNIDYIDSCSYISTENHSNQEPESLPFYINADNVVSTVIANEVSSGDGVGCDYQSTSGSGGVISSNNYFQYIDNDSVLTTEGLESINGIIINGKNESGNSLTFSSEIQNNFGNSSISGDYLLKNVNDTVVNITFSNTNYVMCWTEKYIYCQETESTITEEKIGGFNTINYTVNRNYNLILKDEKNNSELILDTSRHLFIESSNVIFIEDDTISVVIQSLFAIDIQNIEIDFGLVGEEVYITKKEEAFSWLCDGVITSINYEQSLSSVTTYRMTVSVNITNKTKKKYVSFSSETGSVLTKNGSFFSYIRLIGSNNKQNKYDFTSQMFSVSSPSSPPNIDLLGELNNSSFDYAFLGTDYNTSYSLQNPLQIIQRLRTDNLVKNTIYRVILESLNTKTACIEKWKITPEGKILYDGLIEESLRNFPMNANIYSASYYPA